MRLGLTDIIVPKCSMYERASAPMGAWMCITSRPLRNYDRPNNQPTDLRTDPVIGKLSQKTFTD